MTTGQRLGTAIAVIGTVLVAGLIWYLTRSPVAEVDISAARGASDVATMDGAAAVDGLGDLSGQWTIVSGNEGEISNGSFVGYRVEEELAGRGATTAVGRTPAVTGAMTVGDGTVSDTEIEADMTQLASDQGFRDRAIQRQGLETAQFPSASFALDAPLEIPPAAVDGTTVTLAATGTLTLHGVSQQVEVDLEARLLSADRLVVGGSIPIAMSDYDITPPSAQRVVSIDENGIAELQLFFEHAVSG